MTTYTDYRVIDYTNSEALSTYALSATPLVFVPDLDDTYSYRVIWDFGDGTISKSFSATKVFELPGEYSVNLVIYDCDSNALLSNFTKIITVYDYLPYTFDINYGDNSQLVLKCGKIVGPLVFTALFPNYQPKSSIFYSTSGSNSEDYWSINKEKFSHLNNFHTLYDAIFNYTLSSYQYREIDKIEFNTTPLYLKVSGNTLIPCLSSDSGACFAGLTASKDIYIKDDSISDLILTNFWFDKTNTVAVKYANNLGVSLSSQVVDNDEVDHLSITSNGLDGEGYTVDSFNINPIKYFETKIPFVVKIKDGDNFSVKNFDKIPLSALTFTLKGNYITDTKLLTYNGPQIEYNGVVIYYSTPVSTLSSYPYSVYSLNDTLSGQDSGGSFRGYIVFPLSSYDALTDVSISVSGTFISSTSASYTLQGESNRFDVYNKNAYDMFKINEDFNPQQTLMDLRFQETMLDKTVLFEDFLGSLLGNENSDHEAIGVKIYEKIANFVSNTQDVDTSEEEYLNSLAQLVGYSSIGEETYQYPEKLKRIMNLASISKYKLIGALNKFKENLDIKGRSSKTEYGINIGEKIDPLSYTVNMYEPIVALEKFGNRYTVLNTYQPPFVEYINLLTEDGFILTTEDEETLLADVDIFSALSSYPLSAYSEDWGWPLVLPTSFDFSDIEKYYLFFEYNPQYDNTIVGGMIDFNNPRTTVESTETGLFGDGEIFDNMILNSLYQSLSL